MSDRISKDEFRKTLYKLRTGSGFSNHEIDEVENVFRISSRINCNTRLAGKLIGYAKEKEKDEGREPLLASRTEHY